MPASSRQEEKDVESFLKDFLGSSEEVQVFTRQLLVYRKDPTAFKIIQQGQDNDEDKEKEKKKKDEKELTSMSQHSQKQVKGSFWGSSVESTSKTSTSTTAAPVLNLAEGGGGAKIQKKEEKKKDKSFLQTPGTGASVREGQKTLPKNDPPRRIKKENKEAPHRPPPPPVPFVPVQAAGQGGRKCG